MSTPEYWALHEDACARGETIYTDPETGYVVFTRLGLLERDKCCGAGCRHCPFDHDSVPVKRRAARIQQAAWLSDTPVAMGESADDPRPLALLFWSGGKDSFLALRALQKQGDYTIALVTTFDARTRSIAHQELAIDVVVEQADALGLPLIGVPLHAGADYVEQIVNACDLVPQCTTLAFGDLHLETIRNWREQAFAAHPRTAGMELIFPLWGADYEELLKELESSGARCVISAIAADLPGISVSDSYDAALIDKLPQGVDRFGENGEFHTRIIV